jgi:hypothetical protein
MYVCVRVCVCVCVCVRERERERERESMSVHLYVCLEREKEIRFSIHVCFSRPLHVSRIFKHRVFKTETNLWINNEHCHDKFLSFLSNEVPVWLWEIYSTDDREHHLHTHPANHVHSHTNARARARTHTHTDHGSRQT